MRAILARADQEERSFQAIAKEWGEHVDGAWDGNIHNGVAVIPVSGVLMRQLSFFGLLSGSSAYELLVKDIHTALKNPKVKAIILDIDSPGGEVTGVAELAGAIRKMSAEKPIVAYGTGTIASAAYWIASACQRVVISSTSSVGSIGCMATILDYSTAIERAGVKEYRFISSQSPLKNAEPGTDEGNAAIQSDVDAIASIFIQDVANFRQVSVERVASDFGKGGCFVGQAAVDAGLADAVGNLEDLIAELGNDQPTNAVTAPPAVSGGKEMGILRAKSKTSKLSAKARAAEEDQNLEDEDIVDAEGEEDETVAEGEEDNIDAEGEEDDQMCEDDELAEGEEDDLEAEDEEPKPASKKATGERARIAAILNSKAARGRGKQAKHLAFNTNLSAKTAIAILQTAPVAAPTKAAKGNGFDARMRVQGNPKLGVGSAPVKRSAADEAAAMILNSAKHLGIAK